MTIKTANRAFLTAFEIGNRSAFILEFGAGYIRFYANHGQLINQDKTPYEIESPYSAADIWDKNERCYTISVTQCGDVMYIFHPKHQTRTLTRYGNNDWRLAKLELINGPWADRNTSDTALSASGSTGTVTISANGGDVFAQTDVGRLIRLNLINDTTIPWQASLEVTAGKIVRSDGKYYLAVNAGTTGNEKPVHTQGNRSDGGVTWKYLHAGCGTAKINEYKSATSVTAEVIDYIPDNLTTSDWELGLFSAANSYPVAGTFWQKRFVILINTPQGAKIIASQPEDFTNFQDKEYGEQLTESSFTIPILSDRYNQAKWIIGADILAVGTSSGAFCITQKTQSEAWSFENSSISQISETGSKQITPIKINGHILFTDKFGTSIRDLVYSYERDTYDPFDTSISSRHLLLSGITCWAFQDCPDKILWCAVDDGRLIGYTFDSAQQVNAMHQHNLSGAVESICVATSPDENRQDVWLIVRRTIDGVTKRYCEWLDEGMKTSYPDETETIDDLDEREIAESEYVKQNAFYVDSGLIFKRTAGNTATTLKGLKHLIGMEVAIMADGAEKPRQIVNSAGEINIDATDSLVICGLPVKSSYKGQKVYIPSQNSAGIGEIQRIDHLVVMLYRSAGGKIGGRYSNLLDMLYRASNSPMNNSEQLFSGNLIMPWPEGSSDIEEKGANIIIYNDSVFPMNILAISPSIVSRG